MAYFLPFILQFLMYFVIIFATNEHLLSEPKIVYVDGINAWDNCRPGLKRSLSAITGLLISHPAYGSLPYNASRNCFLTVAVPIGYRLRLKALDFDVQGRWKHCAQEDTLHIFDHDRPLEPVELASEQQPLPVGSPGRILGEFCGQMPRNDGKVRKNLVLAESTHNALTLWWHTEPRREKIISEQMFRTSTTTMASAQNAMLAEGFRLLWSSFRHTTACRRPHSAMPNYPNNNGSEFACEDKDQKLMECIPAPLGCNAYADCADESDLDPRRQLAHGCEHIPDDFFGGALLTSSGPKRLLLCAALVLLVLSICLSSCCCWMHFRRKNRNKKRLNSRRAQQPNLESGLQQITTTTIEQKERTQMLRPSVKFATQLPQQRGDHNIYHQVVQQQPPPNFSPPQVPVQAPPAVPKMFSTGQPSGKFPSKLHHSRHQQSSEGSSSSSSQKQQQRQKQRQIQIAMPGGTTQQQQMNNSSTTTATTATSAPPPNNERSTGADSGEYFYVQHRPGNAEFSEAHNTNMML